MKNIEFLAKMAHETYAKAKFAHPIPWEELSGGEQALWYHIVGDVIFNLVDLMKENHVSS